MLQPIPDSALRQFWGSAGTLIELPPDSILAGLRLEEDILKKIQHWHQCLWQEIRGGQSGYPRQAVLETPALEDELLEIMASIPELAHQPRIRRQPTLCLTHDIDYLAPTVQMNLKRIVASRRLQWSRPGDQFLDSIIRLLQLDSDAAGGTGASTLFIPCPIPAQGWKNRLTQWLIDPSYRPTDRLFGELKCVIQRFDCQVGLHGSFLSLSHGLLAQERKMLEEALSRPIRMGRQHWLNLPDQDAMQRIQQGGLTIDSTLGWNGAVGFRGGFARPFPIVLEQGMLWELPLLLMDGPLFDDLKLDTRQVVAKSKALLEIVWQRGGCVAINWHDRAAHADYGWAEAYAEILDWSKAKGFVFHSISEAVATYQNDPMLCR